MHRRLWFLLIKFDYLSRVQDQLVIKGELDGLVQVDHPRSDKLLQKFQTAVSDPVLAGKLSAQFFRERVKLGQAGVCSGLPLLIRHFRSAQHLGVDISVAAVVARLHADAVGKGDAFGCLNILGNLGTRNDDSHSS